MSKQKALFERIAEVMIYQLNNGISPLQKSFVDGGANFTIPFNESTGNKYKGVNALWLAMQQRLDPRWITMTQASMKGLKVQTGSSGTMINFMKTNEMKPMRGDIGQVLRDGENKIRYETVELDEPVLTNAWLFNGEQLVDYKDWSEVAAEQLTPPEKTAGERIADLIEICKPEFKHGVVEPFYDAKDDFIGMPLREEFESEDRYNAAMLYELLHWTGHESRMNREYGNWGSFDRAKAELAVGIAALMLGAEMNISHDPKRDYTYGGMWVDILEKDPFEIHRAASEAQRIVDTIISIEQNRALKIENAPRQQKHLLSAGDSIQYKNNTYNVQEVLKGNTAQMQETNTGRRFRIGPKDGLYTALVNARNTLAQNQAQDQSNSVEQDHAQEQENGIEHGADLANSEVKLLGPATENHENEKTETAEVAVAEEQQVSQSSRRRR